MKIIRDEVTAGLAMIPLFCDWGIRRCNVEDCTDRPTTIVAGIEEAPVFGLCEDHHNEAKEKNEIAYSLVLDDFDAFEETQS